jgi:hypothetical protein
MGLNTGNYQVQFLGELPNGHPLRSTNAYLAPGENKRVDRLRLLKMLFAGFHKAFFLDYGYTQFHFPSIRRNDGQVVPMYVPLNLLTLVSLKMADLLVGEAPAIRVDNDAEQLALDALADRSRLQSTLHAAAVELSWAGEAALEITKRDGVTYITGVDVDRIFPQGLARPDGQYDRYHTYETANTGTEQAPIWLLLQTTFEPGLVRRTCWQISGRYGSKMGVVALTNWPTPGLVEQEITGLSRPSIVWLSAGRPGQTVSDYDTLVSLQDELSAKQTQLARSFAKHGDPKIFIPTSQAGPDGNLRAEDDAYFGDNPEAKPSYIEFNSQPTAAMADRDFTLHAFCVAAEIPPNLLGIKNDATAESARKMRLSASNALAKAARRAAAMKPSIRLALQLAREMEGGPRDLQISVEMRDGLPNDDQERADVIATLRAAGAISIEGALELRGLDAAAVDKEMKRLADESASAAPSLLGESAVNPAGVPLDEQSDDNSADHGGSRPNNAA